MKLLHPINQNIPIWSTLCGDHALKNQTKLLNESLINAPNFYNELENKLRLEIFKSKRNWIIKKIGDFGSFGLMQFSCRDLKKFYTCFKDVEFHSFAKEYKNCFHQRKKFNYKDVEKSKQDIEDMYDLMIKIEKQYINTAKKDVLSEKLNNIDDISVALNRTIILKNENKYHIIDGTHRLVAYYWSKYLNRNNSLLDNLYAFYIEKTYELP